MNKDWKNHLKKIGSLGGKATSKKYGKKHYQKMVQIREEKKQNLTKASVLLSE